jgi:hypothetical protein
LVLAAGLVLLVAGCKERLEVPTDCAVACGPGLAILDTIIDALPASDTSHVGYVGLNEAPSLLLSNGTDAGVSHAVISFDVTPDSVDFNGTNYAATIDSVIMILGLVSRDTLVNGSRLLIYRLPPQADSTLTFAEVESYFTPARLIDSMSIPDTVHTGELKIVFSGDSLLQVVIPPGDSGRVSLGIKLHADTLTALRIGSRLTGGFLPGYITHATGEESLPEPRNRSIDPEAVYTGFVRNTMVVTDPDLLVVGGLPASRALLRFMLPEEIRGQASLLRATLRLTPDRPYYGVPFDRTGLEVRHHRPDLGYRSPPTAVGTSGSLLPLDGSADLEVEVNGIVSLWFQSSQIAQVLYLSVTTEGAAFAEPVFRSTRSVAGSPRLHITYVLPGRPETP